MRAPTRPEALRALEDWQRLHNTLVNHVAAAQAAGCLDINGPLWDVMWRVFDSYTKTLALALDAGDWLDWYCAENSMGAKSMYAGYDGKLRCIKDIKGLLRLIEIGRKRELAGHA